jgi:hypothetical protein
MRLNTLEVLTMGRVGVDLYPLGEAPPEEINA